MTWRRERSKNCYIWKDGPGLDLTSLNTDNVDFRTRSRPYQPEAFGPSGPGLGLGIKNSSYFGRVLFRFHPLPPSPKLEQYETWEAGQISWLSILILHLWSFEPDVWFGLYQ